MIARSSIVNASSLTSSASALVPVGEDVSAAGADRASEFDDGGGGDGDTGQHNRRA